MGTDVVGRADVARPIVVVAGVVGSTKGSCAGRDTKSSKWVVVVVGTLDGAGRFVQDSSRTDEPSLLLLLADVLLPLPPLTNKTTVAMTNTTTTKTPVPKSTLVRRLLIMVLSL